MPSSKSSLSEEQIFADIMEMISSSNKKSKNTKNVKNNKNNKNNNSKKNMKGGVAPFVESEMSAEMFSDKMEMGSPIPGLNDPSRDMGITVSSEEVEGPMGTTGMDTMMQGGKPAKKRVMKPLKKAVKKPVKKAAVKKVVKKAAVKKVVKKAAVKKPVKKAAVKKPVKKVAKKSKPVKK
jgi:hypothetical protein